MCVHFHLFFITLKQMKVALQHAKQALRGGTGIALPTLNSASRGRWVVNTISHLLYSQKSNLVSTVQVAGWAFGPVWKILLPLGFEVQPTQKTALTMLSQQSCSLHTETLATHMAQHSIQRYDSNTAVMSLGLRCM
jgi:hypothetical protein